jgi:hypothetical protein
MSENSEESSNGNLSPSERQLLNNVAASAPRLRRLIKVPQRYASIDFRHHPASMPATDSDEQGPSASVRSKAVYTAEEEADREREQETDETAASANIPRRLLLSIPSPAEIPFFKGRPEKGTRLLYPVHRIPMLING